MNFIVLNNGFQDYKPLLNYQRLECLFVELQPLVFGAICPLTHLSLPFHLVSPSKQYIHTDWL